jgi:organic hydroperoxide reductase OsmC/OhrA
MSKYKITITWSRRGAKFIDNRYSRGHSWLFDGGIEVSASSSPHIVPLPYSIEAAVDPEEAFVASLSSCHMLWFLSIAAKCGLIVESYTDEAVGVLEENESGNLAMTLVTLHPDAEFSGGNLPSKSQVIRIHNEAHEQCFIARSVRTVVRCEPVWEKFTIQTEALVHNKENLHDC